MMKTLESIEKYILYAVVFLLPLAFASIGENPFVITKLSILVFGIGAVFLMKSIRTVLSGTFTWATTPFDFPILLLSAAYIASTIFRTPNIMEALLFPGTTTAVVGGTLLFFLINQLQKSEKENIYRLLFVSGIIFSVLTLLAGLRLFENLSFLPLYMQNPIFTPLGGYLPSALYLAVLLPIGVSFALKSKDIVVQSAYIISSVVILFSLGFAIFNLTSSESNLTRGTALRSSGFNTSWIVSVDSLKESPLLGSGPANYFTAFSRFRPLEYNQTDNWRFKFATANNYYLTVITETGMLGVASLILIFTAFYKYTRKEILPHTKNIQYLLDVPTYLSIGLLFVLLFFFPASIFITILLFILLSVTITSSMTSLNLSSMGENHKRSNLPALIIGAPIILLVGYIFMRSYTFIRAEYTYKKSLDAIAANDGVVAYDLLRNAISINPYVDRYHSRYSQVNLALANSLAAQITDGQITDEQRAQITQLVQQSIREARVTVQLNPLRSNGWEQLARTYQAIIPLAQGADAFASQSYRQAIQLDPINPNLRIALGQLHYAQNDYEGAINIFSLAAQVKPDLANSYFNLAFALREAGKIDLAKIAMSNVLANLDSNSSDYAIAVQVVEDLNNLADTTPTEGVEIEAPEPGVEPVIDPQIELGNEDTPPEPAISPENNEEENDNSDDEPVTPEEEPTPLP